MRRPTVEWQVCGVCNYDCSYCIQSKASRVGHPSDADVERFLAFFERLDFRSAVRFALVFAFVAIANSLADHECRRINHGERAAVPGAFPGPR